MSLTEEELAIRLTGITATDATGITGTNRFWDPVAVYLHKTDPEKVADRAEENPTQKALGHELEPVVIRMLGREEALMGATMVTTKTMRSEKHSWALATPDRLVMREGPGPCAVAEAKNVGVRMVADWRDSDDPDEWVVPAYVHVQVQWQMIVANVMVAYVGALLGGRDFRAWTIYSDDLLRDTLLSVCGDFWHKHVLKRIPPTPAATERAAKAIAAMFPSHSEAIIPAPPHAEALADQYIDARAQEEYFYSLRMAAENQLKMVVGGNAGMVGSDWRLTWKTTSSTGVDWKRVAETMAGANGVPTELVKAYTRPGTRRFLLTPSKQRKALAASAAAHAIKQPCDQASSGRPETEE